MKIPILHILEINRQRQDYQGIPELWESIQRTKGLIHPITVSKRADGMYTLIAGGRRLAAHRHGQQTEIECNFREEMTQEDIHELELEENLRRSDITWQERCLGVAHLYDLRSHTNALQGINFTHNMCGEMLGLHRSHVRNILIVADCLRQDKDKTSYWSCESLTDAIKLKLKRQTDDYVAELTRRTIQPSASTPKIEQDSPVFDYGEDDEAQTAIYVERDEVTKRRLPLATWKNQDEARKQFESNPLNKGTYQEYYDFYHKESNAIPITSWFRNLDCRTYMKDKIEAWGEAGWCDHIITDPPYGIDMDMLEQASGGLSNIDDVENEHDEDENKGLLEQFIPLAYKSLRPGGYLAMWGDYMMWQQLYDWCISAGFKVQRWPIIWHKTGPNKNGAAYVNFTKNTELCIIARKGNATLAQTCATSVISCSNVETIDSGHAFQKPFESWAFLINKLTHANQLIYDPFAGRFSMPLAAIRLGRKVLACEKQSNHYNYGVELIKQYYTQTLDDSTTFS